MDFIKKLDDGLANLFVFVITIVTIVAVFMRYILHDPLQWIEEVLVALYLWAIMFGAASAMKVRGHVSIDAFVVFLPPKAQRYVQHFNDVLGIVILLTFGWLGLQLSLAAGEKITPILGLKYSLIDLAVPIGACWMAFHLLVRLISDIKNNSSNVNGD